MACNSFTCLRMTEGSGRTALRVGCPVLGRAARSWDGELTEEHRDLPVDVLFGDEVSVVSETAPGRPLHVGSALIVFALSAIPFWPGLFLVLPALYRATRSASLALSVAFLIPLAILLAAALVAASRERTAAGWTGLAERLRLRPLGWKQVAWSLPLLAITLTGYFGLSATTTFFELRVGLKAPAELDLVSTGKTFWGFELAGNWWVVLLHVGILVLNVAGEELWFRGILFPRQLAAHGPRAWLVHGLCYHLFHMFYPWDVLRLLPESIAYGWVAQRSGSTWPGLISHFLFNGLGLIATVHGVLASP